MNWIGPFFQPRACGALLLAAFGLLACSERNPLELDRLSDGPRLNTSAYGASETVLDFEDGLLPSAHGWTFQTQGGAADETQVAFVSNGILFLETTPFGVDLAAFWSIPLSPIDPANYVMEIRMRAFLPDGLRSFCRGSLGAAFETQGNFVTEVSLMPRQLSVTGLPGTTCPSQINLPADGENFHTYRVEVDNNDQATIFVDGSPVVTGTLVLQPPQHQILLGDLSTSGGNVKAEIDFIRVASLIKIVPIDIKPGSDPNSISMRSRGSIPVAILSTDEFNAPAELDREWLRFGATGDENSLDFCTKSAEDANQDGRLDLVCHFSTQETGFQSGDTEGILTGQTLDGTAIEGGDAVQIVGK